jgi:hypothetical protein
VDEPETLGHVSTANIWISGPDIFWWVLVDFGKAFLVTDFLAGMNFPPVVIDVK